MVSYILKIFMRFHSSCKLLSSVYSSFDLRVEFFVALNLSDVPLFGPNFLNGSIFTCIERHAVILDLLFLFLFSAWLESLCHHSLEGVSGWRDAKLLNQNSGKIKQTYLSEYDLFLFHNSVRSAITF